jgi:hypothetical protein
VTKPSIWVREYTRNAVLKDDWFDEPPSEEISMDGHKVYTLQEVMQLHDWPEYQKAMRVELNAIQDNQTWEPVDTIPDFKSVVGYTWSFTKKIYEEPIRYKARLCAQGFTQRHGLDYFETFSPVIRQASIRILLSIAAAENMHIHQMDVNSAFLQGKIDTEVYMKAPPELGLGENKYLRLKKALYGLKQASRIWNNNLNEFLLSIGFKRSKIEPCIYTSDEHGDKIIIGVYVDDLIILSKNMANITYVKSRLCAQYPMKDLKDVKNIIGMQVSVTEGNVCISQNKYIDALISRFNLVNAYNTYTPMKHNITYTKDMNIDTDSNVILDDIPYRQALGALLYTVQCTRPDIAFAVSKLSSYMNGYNLAHWHGVEDVLKYLKTTKHYSLCYKRHHDKKKRNVLIGFCDSDWGSCIDTRRSQTGYIFYMNGAPISWASVKQSTVAISSVEAEYMALSSATQEMLYLRQLLEDIGYAQEEATIIYEDNQPCINLANDQTYSKRTKHIDIRHHFIRDEVVSGRLRLVHVPTAEQCADIMTKALAHIKFNQHACNIMSTQEAVEGHAVNTSKRLKVTDDHPSCW